MSYQPTYVSHKLQVRACTLPAATAAAADAAAGVCVKKERVWTQSPSLAMAQQQQHEHEQPPAPPPLVVADGEVAVPAAGVVARRGEVWLAVFEWMATKGQKKSHRIRFHGLLADAYLVRNDDSVAVVVVNDNRERYMENEVWIGEYNTHTCSLFSCLAQTDMCLP